MINKFIANGRTTKDIELAKSQSGVSIVKFALAITRNFKNKEGNFDSDFINCIAYKGTADIIAQYVKKGDLIGIEGRLQSRSYTAQDGTKRYVTEIVIDNVDFLAHKKQEEIPAAVTPAAATPAPKVEQTDIYQEFGDNIDESELPF